VLARVPERPPPVPAVRPVLVVLLVVPVALAGAERR
jgi:hypothetical protein